MIKKYFEWAEEFPGYVVVRKEGNFYTARNESAEILHDLLGYNLGKQGVNNCLTGSIVLGDITNALNQHKLNYVIIIDNEVYEQVEFENGNSIPITQEQNGVRNIGLSNRNQENNNQENNNHENERISQIEIVNGLLKGINPFTGEVFDDEHILHYPKVREILELAKSTIDRRENYAKNKPPAAGGKWTKEEEDQLINEYRSGKSIKEIAKIHDRSNGAIYSRLQKHFIME